MVGRRLCDVLAAYLGVAFFAKNYFVIAAVGRASGGSFVYVRRFARSVRGFFADLERARARFFAASARQVIQRFALAGRFGYEIFFVDYFARKVVPRRIYYRVGISDLLVAVLVREILTALRALPILDVAVVRAVRRLSVCVRHDVFVRGRRYFAALFVFAHRARAGLYVGRVRSRFDRMPFAERMRLLFGLRRVATRQFARLPMRRRVGMPFVVVRVRLRYVGTCRKDKCARNDHRIIKNAVSDLFFIFHRRIIFADVKYV